MYVRCTRFKLCLWPSAALSLKLILFALTRYKGAGHRQHGIDFMNSQHLEFHVWALEWVSLRFETTYEDYFVEFVFFDLLRGGVHSDPHPLISRESRELNRLAFHISHIWAIL